MSTAEGSPVQDASFGYTGRDPSETLVLAALESVDDLEPRRYVVEHNVAKRELDVVSLEEAAERRGLASMRISPEIRVFHDGTRALGFHKNMSSALLYLDRAVTNRKPLTKRILTNAGLPVARSAEAESENQVAGAFEALGSPVVVKPVMGSGGRGVSLDLRAVNDAVEAAAPILEQGRNVLVEEMIAAIDLRVTVVAGKTVGATFRVPASVVGDGVSSIATLVAAKNDLRRSNDYVRHQLIEISPTMEQFLADRGLSLQSVPASRERVLLHYVANISAGGDSYEILDRLHPEVKAVAEAAADCFPSARHAGIDLLLERFDAPLAGQRVVICEVNLNNELPMHLYPLYGPSSPVDDAVLAAHWDEEATIPAATLDAQDAPAAVKVNLDELQALTEAPREIDMAPPPSREAAVEMAGDRPTDPDTSPEIDDARQREALDKLLSDDRHVETTAGGRLVHLRGARSEEIGERTGRTVLAGAVGSDPSVMHRYARFSGIPVMARHWLRSGDLEKATELAARRWRRWLLRIPDSDGRTTVVPVDSAADVHAAWHRVPDSGRFRMLEAPTGPACVLLMAGGHLQAAQFHVPLTVRGDGRSTLIDLVSAELARRRNNIILRQSTEDLNAEDLISTAGLEPDSVLDHDDRVEVVRSARLQDGAATIGLAELPWPQLELLAARFNAAIGNPGLATMAFVPRRRTASEATWALWRFHSEPGLAQFRYPLNGPGFDAYPEAARRIVTRPRRPLTPS